jgi:predicted nucleic acid-binding protein
MRAYLDNVAASGRVVGDLVPASEMEALRDIERAASAGLLKMVTSRESWREQERTKDPVKRARLEAARSEVSAVATDHVVLGFSELSGPYGTIATNPIATDIVDEALFADLKSSGLDDSDARHLMYAVANACDRFVTLDPDFLDRRIALEARCQSLRILRPSELVAELQSDPRWGQRTLGSSGPADAGRSA